MLGYLSFAYCKSFPSWRFRCRPCLQVCLLLGSLDLLAPFLGSRAPFCSPFSFAEVVRLEISTPMRTMPHLAHAHCAHDDDRENQRGRSPNFVAETKAINSSAGGAPHLAECLQLQRRHNTFLAASIEHDDERCGQALCAPRRGLLRSRIIARCRHHLLLQGVHDTIPEKILVGVRQHGIEMMNR